MPYPVEQEFQATDQYLHGLLVTRPHGTAGSECEGAGSGTSFICIWSRSPALASLLRLHLGSSGTGPGCPEGWQGDHCVGKQIFSCTFTTTAVGLNLCLGDNMICCPSHTVLFSTRKGTVSFFAPFLQPRVILSRSEPPPKEVFSSLPSHLQFSPQVSG